MPARRWRGGADQTLASLHTPHRQNPAKECCQHWRPINSKDEVTLSCAEPDCSRNSECLCGISTFGIDCHSTEINRLSSGHSVTCASGASMADGTMWLMRQGHHGRPELQPLSGPLPPPTARKGLPTAQPLREARSPKPPPPSFARAETSPKPWHQPVRGRGIRVETRTSPDRRVCLCQNPPSTGCRQNRRRHACSLVHKHQVHSPSAGPVASPMPIRAC